MIKQGVTVDDVIELLNEAYRLDSDAMDILVKTRVLCNDDLASHPTIQVAGPSLTGTGCKVGFVGILNGIFGSADDGFGAIAADFDVVCLNGHETPEKARLKDKCSVCGENLVLGKLTGFKRIR